MTVWRAKKRALGASYVPRKKNPTPTAEQRKEWWQRYSKANRARLNAMAVEYGARQKAEAVAAYGGACVCCGEDELVFLTFDHIVPIRSRHRKGVLAHELKRQGYPVGYQVLCYNCNCAKRTGDECPHRLIVRRKLMLVEPRPA